MHALHNIHAALASDAILVDTQPLSERPPVAAGGAELGTLDMREWLETIRAVDALFAQTIAAGLYELLHEQRISVTDTFDTGPECLATVSGWRGTQVPRLLASRLAAAQLPVTVDQEVRLRLLRRATQAREPADDAGRDERFHSSAAVTPSALDDLANNDRTDQERMA